MIKKYGTHSPFDSDACINWTIFCHVKNHDIDTPIELEEKEFDKVLGYLPKDDKEAQVSDTTEAK